ncbi:MAG: putative DNA-binding domain-containing protein [Acidiferrobacterales bacterium]
MNTSKSHSPSERNNFTKKQYEFAAYIRDPQNNPRPPEIEDRRMAIYRELFFNNIEDFMTSSFPVLKEILGEDRWQKLLQDYFANHRAETPLFPQLPAEFLKYLNHVRRPQASDPNFMVELAHYEWMELAALQSNEQIDWDCIDKDGELLSGHPVISPLAWILSYEYPVHQISKDFQPKKPGEQPTNIIVYRDLKDEVGFIEINPMTTVLLNRLQQDGQLTSEHVLQELASEMQHADPAVVIDGGMEILNNLKSHDIVLGVTKNF